MTAFTTSRRRQRVLGPSDSRAPTRRKAHGLSVAERDTLASLQGGACAVCRQPSDRLQIDHDHRHCPGTEGCRLCIRGLLCPKCNSGLGWIGDTNIPRLLAYLTR